MKYPKTIEGHKQWATAEGLCDQCISPLSKGICSCNGWTEHKKYMHKIRKVFAKESDKQFKVHIAKIKDRNTKAREHEEFTFQPNASEKLYMDEVIEIALNSTDVIEKGLKKYGITMTDEQEDNIYLFVEREIERFSNGEYRSHM